MEDAGRDKKETARRMLEAGCPFIKVRDLVYNGHSQALVEHITDGHWVTYQKAVRMRDAAAEVVRTMDGNRVNGITTVDDWLNAREGLNHALMVLAESVVGEAALEASLCASLCATSQQNHNTPETIGVSTIRDIDRATTKAEAKILAAVERLPPPRSWSEVEKATRVVVAANAVTKAWRTGISDGDRSRSVTVAALTIELPTIQSHTNTPSEDGVVDV